MKASLKHLMLIALVAYKHGPHSEVNRCGGIEVATRRLTSLPIAYDDRRPFARNRPAHY